MKTKHNVTKEQFYADLDKMREKYPMCVLNPWVPEDFNMEWNDPQTVQLVDIINDKFDANDGISWNFIKWCKSFLDN